MCFQLLEQLGNFINGPATIANHSDDGGVFQCGNLLPQILVPGLERFDLLFVFLQFGPEFLQFGIDGNNTPFIRADGLISKIELSGKHG